MCHHHFHSVLCSEDQKRRGEDSNIFTFNRNSRAQDWAARDFKDDDGLSLGSATCCGTEVPTQKEVTKVMAALVEASQEISWQDLIEDPKKASPFPLSLSPPLSLSLSMSLILFVQFGALQSVPDTMHIYLNQNPAD